MKITSRLTQSKGEWNSTQGKMQYFSTNIHGSSVSTGIVTRCIDYAKNRLKLFPINFELVRNVDVSRNENGYITVSFRGEYGALKISGIMLNAGGWPHNVHGIMIDENDTFTECPE